MNLNEFILYVEREVKDRFGADCNAYSYFGCAFMVNVDAKYVNDVESFVLGASDELNVCKINMHRYNRGVRTLEFTNK